MAWVSPPPAVSGAIITSSWGSNVQSDLLYMGGTDGVSGYATPGTNLLVNGGYEINQRGGTITANNAYAHDRWQVLLGGTSTISVTDETTTVDTNSGHALKAVYTQGTANSQIDQKLEDYKQLRGKTLSLSIRVRQGAASNVRPYISDSGTKTYGTASATTGSYVTLTVTLAIGSGATSVNVGVDLGASDTVYVDNAMLVMASAAAPYVPLPPADELNRCLRYYWKSGTNTGEIYGYAANGSGAGLTLAVGVTFPVHMGGAPTVTINGPWATSNCGAPVVSFSGQDRAVLTSTSSANGNWSFGNNAVGAYLTAEWNP